MATAKSVWEFTSRIAGNFGEVSDVTIWQTFTKIAKFQAHYFKLDACVPMTLGDKSPILANSTKF